MAEEDIKNHDDEALLPIREDIAEWLSAVLGHRVAEESLFDDLQTGATLCQTAHAICKLVERNDTMLSHIENSRQLKINYRKCKDENSLPLPKPPKYSKNAKPGSFLARDNAANFIAWCRKLGIKDTCMFESEGLVLQTQKKNVLLCLLEVARHLSEHGLPTPQLIHLEKDINHEEAKDTRLLHRNKYHNNAFARVPPTLDRRKRTKVLQLDDAVHKIVDGSKFRGLVDIERTGEGRYRIQDKLVFIRMLRNRHVMVRVGGGWDTLDHYLLTHETTHLEQKFKHMSFTDVERKYDGFQRAKESKFHQVRTRIPLRTKQW